MRKGFCPQLVIPAAFENCMTYAKQVLWLWKHVADLETRVDALEKKQNDNKA